MQKNPIYINEKKYISSRRAADMFGYTTDYIGQLARSGKIESKMVGRDRYVGLESLELYIESGIAHKKHQSALDKKKLSRGIDASVVSLSEKTDSVVDKSPSVIPPAPKPLRVSFAPTRKSLIFVDDEVSTAMNFGTLVHEETDEDLIDSESFAREDKSGTMVFASLLVALTLSLYLFAGGANSEIFVSLRQSKQEDQNTAQAAMSNPIVNVNSSALAKLFESGDRVDEVYLGALRDVDQAVLNFLSRARAKLLALVDKFGSDDKVKDVPVVVDKDRPIEVATPSTPVNTDGRSLTDADLEAIAETVANKLHKRVDYTSRADTNTLGIVTAPATGDPIADALRKDSIKQSFSDDVDVSFDSAGGSGVIKPIFRNGQDDEYFFVVVPVNDATE